MRYGGHTIQSGFAERFGSLLSATAEMLGATIEIWDGEPRPLYADRKPKKCADCRRANPEAFAECQSCRDDLVFRHGPILSAKDWICQLGYETTVLPFPLAGHPTARLIAVRPELKQSPTGGTPRGEMSRFLTHFVELMGVHMSVAGQLESISDELTARHEELNLLYTISGRAAAQEDVRRAIRMILEQARRAVGATAALVHIPDRRTFESSMLTGPDGEDALKNGTLKRLAENLEMHFESTGQPVFSGRSSALDSLDTGGATAPSVLAVTLEKRGHQGGVLAFVYEPGEMKERPTDLRFLDSLSERIVMAAASADLYEDMKDFLMATVKSLVSAIEAKDAYTSGHSARVHLLSMLLGKTMGISEDDLETLQWASILHDVGKIGMPEEILKKPGRLTEDEYAIMKEHPERGYRILAPIRQLSSASLAVRCHHERFDGLGYPLGLRGTEIPLRSRIIAVADTYDALTSTRSYRARRGPEAAFAEIHRVRGTQLDPDVVDSLELLMPFIIDHEVMLRAGSAEGDLDWADEQEEYGEEDRKAA